MKSFLIALACFATSVVQQEPPLAPVAIPKSGSAIVVPVFAEHNFRVRRKQDLVRARLELDKAVAMTVFGTAFALQVDGRVLLVTAAHVVQPSPPITEVAGTDGKRYDTSDGATTIEAETTRVLVSGLAFTPKRMLVDRSQDIALMELEPGDLNLLQLQTLSAGAVKRDDPVKLWGFPVVPRRGPKDEPLPSAPSASQTSQRADVTDVRDGEVVCAMLNGVETRGGFSGGPAVDADGTVVGVIMRSTAETTRCRDMPSVVKLAKSFEADAKAYKEDRNE